MLNWPPGRSEQGFWVFQCPICRNLHEFSARNASGAEIWECRRCGNSEILNVLAIPEKNNPIRRH